MGYDSDGDGVIGGLGLGGGLGLIGLGLLRLTWCNDECRPIIAVSLEGNLSVAKQQQISNGDNTSWSISVE
jgi:hypothetical protein